MIAIVNLYWTAGFFEGEAWFGSRNNYATPCINVDQQQKEPLERLAKLYGGNIKWEKRNKQRNGIWRWGIYGNKAAALMMTLYSIMSPKRQQRIFEILSIWKSHNIERKQRWAI